MSQAGVLNVIASAPTIPTSFVENIGSATPAANILNILGGTGISTVGSGNTVTINAIGSGITWSDTSGSFTAAIGNGYFLTAAATPTLPAAPAEGDTIEFIVTAAATVTITASPGQFIRLGNTITAASGTCASATIGNAITLVYRVVGTTWWATSAVGSWTLT